MNKLKKLLKLFNQRERKQAYLLLVMITIMAFLEMIGVASILPFIAVLANPEVVETNYFLNNSFKFLNAFGVKNINQFLFFLGVIVLALLLVSLLFKALTIYVQTRFVQMREYSISKRLVESYLRQPYDWFLNRNSGELGKSILSEVTLVVTNGISPLMELASKGMIVIAMLVLLTLTDPKLMLIIGFTFSSIYGLIFMSAQRYLRRIGKEHLISNKLRFSLLNEVFGAIKEVKLAGLEKIYRNRFSEPAYNYARHQASLQILNQIPRFGIEAIAFGGMLLIILYMMSDTDNFSTILPIITVYAFAGYRLMPALQKVYSSINKLKFMGPAIDNLYKEINNTSLSVENNNNDIFQFKKNIVLSISNFNYPNASKTTLKDINITISAKSTVGLVGATGSGKTTVVDIILGLLETQGSTVKVDGVDIKKNIRSWQKNIGYVPQHIYIADDTIAANIAFGVNPKKIDYDMVEKVSKISKIHDFIIDSLPEKYQTTVGERGIRLSGGQLQRIGIARALYHNPQLLVLDEATSALDNQTEKAVIDAINNLRNDITIIVIAHRLNTLKDCDNIYVIDNGRIKTQGKFKNLFQSSEVFEALH